MDRGQQNRRNMTDYLKLAVGDHGNSGAILKLRTGVEPPSRGSFLIGSLMNCGHRRKPSRYLVL